MLEGRRGWKPQGFLQFLDKRVRIQRVEEVDVTRRAEQNYGRRRWTDVSRARQMEMEKVTRSGRNRPHTPLNGNSPSVTKA